MQENILLNFLKQSTLFQAVHDEALQALVRVFKLVNLPARSLVLKKGDYGDKMYFVLEGQLEVFITEQNDKEKIINTLEQGDYFGELALLVDSVRSASVRTVTACKLACLDKDSFDIFLNLHQSAARELLAVIGKRLAHALHLLHEGGKVITVIVHYDNETEDSLQKFTDYFTKISPYPLKVVESLNADSELAKYKTSRENYYFLIKHHINKPLNLAHKIDHSVSFSSNLPANFVLTSTKSQWQIETIVRRITQKTVGIALSSGGAPATSHIGILNKFKKENIPLDFIAGTSAGAVYGANYAFGFEFNKLIEIFQRELSKPKLYMLLRNLSFNFSGLMRSKHLENMIRPIFGDSNLEDALIPLATVASDLYTGKTVVLKKGNTVMNILASNAAPLIIEPLKLDNYLLIDGVATAPLPINVLIDERINLKIAVPVSQLDLVVSMSSRPKLASVYFRSRSMMAEELSKYSTDLADVVIKPMVSGARLFDWQNINKYIEAGEAAAENSIHHIRKFLAQKKS